MVNSNKRKFDSISDPKTYNQRSLRPFSVIPELTYKPTPMMIEGAVTRRYKRSYRNSRRYSKALTYGRPMMRGYSSINRHLAELKSLFIDLQPMPIGMGNVTGTYQWAGPPTNQYTQWTGTNSDGVFIILNSVPTGADLNQRIGRQVKAKSMLIQLTWTLREDGAGSVNPLPTAIRSMLVLDKSRNGLDPPLSDILQPVFHVANQYPGVNSPNNLTYRQRFKTLWDCHDTLSPAGDSIREYDKFIPLNFTTVYSSGVADAISSNALYLILLSSQREPAAAPNPQISLRPMCKVSTRFRYTDQ